MKRAGEEANIKPPLALHRLNPMGQSKLQGQAQSRGRACTSPTVRPWQDCGDFILLVFSCSFISDCFATPWTITHQAPLSMGFSRQEYWLLLCCVSRSVVSDSLQPQGLEPSRLLCPWDSPGKNTGMGCYFLLQRIFPTQGWNLCLLHDKQILLLLSQQGSPEPLGKYCICINLNLNAHLHEPFI